MVGPALTTARSTSDEDEDDDETRATMWDEVTTPPAIKATERVYG